MAITTFDTHKFVRRLEQAGVPLEQAEVQAEVLTEAFKVNLESLVTKDYLAARFAEQNAAIALRYADHGYVLENGRVVLDGPAADLAGNEDIKEFYLGFSGGGRRSFRDVKHYRRRKRWLA